MVQRYIEYLSNHKEIWKTRFTWNGLYGNAPQYAISIVSFLKETNAFEKITKYKDARSLHKEISKVAKIFADWCMFKDIYTQEEYVKLQNFFLGAIGELFFTILLRDVKCFLIKDRYTEKKKRIDFNYVTPRLENDMDFGIDLTGEIVIGKRSQNCAIQVKFWNPELDTPMTNTIASTAYTDAVVNGFVKWNDKNNIVICWLGDTDRVTTYLKSNKPLYEHIIFIDNDVLDSGINGAQPTFWENFYDVLQDIKNW